MSLKLVTYPALFRSQKVIIVAELAKVALEIDTNCTQVRIIVLGSFKTLVDGTLSLVPSRVSPPHPLP
jgi:hypothetical protein